MKINMSTLKQFVISLVSFIFFDFIWLGFVMRDFNLRQLAEVGRIEDGVFQIQLLPAMITYVLMALALPLYVVPRLKKQALPLHAFLTGAPMGLIIYGVFDTTNLAILKNYPVTFVIPDVAWGTFIFGLVTVIVTRFKDTPP
jgi:uncharacterized membrane protein